MQITHRPRPRGFTIVELIVVVFAFSFGVSFLLPSLMKARGQAIRASCLSNQHQIGIYLMMYAQQYNGFVPLGNNPNVGISGYAGSQEIMFQISPAKFGTDGKQKIEDWCIFGCLFAANILGPGPGQVFYCPSNQRVPGFQFNSNDPALGEANLWPTSADFCDKHQQQLWIGYSPRPCMVAPSAGAAPQWSWTWNNDPDPKKSNNKFGALGEMVSGGLPKMSQLNRYAILSDLDMGDAYTNMLHKDGSNVLYGDGSAHWVSRRSVNDKTKLSYDEYLKRRPALVTDKGIKWNDDDQFQYWNIFDQEH